MMCRWFAILPPTRAVLKEYVECTRILTSEESIKAFEINVSCPNVKEGGLQFGNDIKAVGNITSKVKAVTNKPVIIKLSPNVSYIAEFARVVKEEKGRCGIGNKYPGRDSLLNIFTRKPENI